MLRSRRHRAAIALLALTLLSGSGGRFDPGILAAIAIVLILAKTVGDLFERIGQPAVLGELLAGVLLGNLDLAGWTWFETMSTSPVFVGLAEIGVILLLFEVGLESDMGKMARSGAAATAVATIGVITPMALGYGVHYALVPEASWHLHLFIGAVLTATSVGITARVLRDMKRIDSPTARVILGAAVIDDVMGLVVLAVVVGIVTGADGGEPLGVLAIAKIAGLALGFLAGALVLGRPASVILFRLVGFLQIRGILLAAALAFCFLLSFGAGEVGLHPIVGAFAAGLVLDEVAYRGLRDREPQGLEEQIKPISGFLVPIFFVATGAAVDFGAFDADMLLLAVALIVVAIAGKQACALAAFGEGVDRVSVGVGMIPRGEVGLIFASVGSSLTMGGEPVVSPSTYAAVVLMVMVTTFITPPLLQWALGRSR